MSQCTGGAVRPYDVRLWHKADNAELLASQEMERDRNDGGLLRQLPDRVSWWGNRAPAYPERRHGAGYRAYARIDRCARGLVLSRHWLRTRRDRRVAEQAGWLDRTRGRS